MDRKPERTTSQRPGKWIGTGPLFAGIVGLAAALPGLSDGAKLAAQSDSDFLFSTPQASLAFRVGYSLPRAGEGKGTQSLWDLTREQLTINTADFGGVSLSGELGIRTTERLDVAVTLGYTLAETTSEFRDWVDENDFPIEQVTEFSTLPLTLGIKAYLLKRGRSVGRFAWIPRTWNPYAGIAGGLVWYRFEQFGDFVDFDTWDIFTDNFRSKGRAPTLHLLGGVDMSLNGRFMLTGEARYGFASAPLDADFVGFPDLDLAGFQATAGIAVRF